MEWLKTVKDLHGSVEKTSLSRAQLINRSGTYTIGNEKEKIPTVENCLKMLISESDTNEGTAI